MGPALAPVGHNQQRAPECRAPCAHTVSPGQKQTIGVAGSRIIALGTLCRPSAVIHVLVQLCLKGRGSDLSAERDEDYQCQNSIWTWLELFGVAKAKGCAASSQGKKIKRRLGISAIFSCCLSHSAPPLLSAFSSWPFWKSISVPLAF